MDFTIPNSKAKVQNIHTLSYMAELSENGSEVTKIKLYNTYKVTHRQTEAWDRYKSNHTLR